MIHEAFEDAWKTAGIAPDREDVKETMRLFFFAGATVAHNAWITAGKMVPAREAQAFLDRVERELKAFAGPPEPGEESGDD